MRHEIVSEGAVAQLGERGLCKPEVVGSIPISSTRTSTLDHLMAGFERPVGKTRPNDP
jgi:hypothetical protein